MQSMIEDEGLSVAITDTSLILDAPNYHALLRRLQRHGCTSSLLKPMPDKGDQVSTLVRLAVLYDIYLDYRFTEEGIGEGPGTLLDRIPLPVQELAVRVAPAVANVASAALYGWLTGRQGGKRSLSRLAEAVKSAEARG
jgi:hypothetical protein